MKYDLYISDSLEEINHSANAESEGCCITDAVVRFLKKQASYDEGTQGRKDYLKIQQVTCFDDYGVNCTAYREAPYTWDVHIQTDSGLDESFKLTL